MPLFFMITSHDFYQEGKTPFTPSYNYSIVEGYIDDKDLEMKKLIHEILSKEKDIIENSEYVSDWGTRLGRNSLTSRSDIYNLLNFDNIKLLKESISEMHKIYLDMKEVQSISEKYYAHCWANVMRKKEKIFPHRHCRNAHSYLSGHVCLQVKDTYTHYINPFDDSEWKSENKNNKITLFPSYIKHYTDSVTTEQIRITVAFDLITKETYDEDIIDSKKSQWSEI